LNASVTAYVYNNTIVDGGDIGIMARDGVIVAKNNIVDCDRSDFSSEGGGSFSAEFENNISSDATALGGTNNQINTTVKFIDEANDDFHLSPLDTSAIDAGTDLSADANFAFTTDIDGHLRTDWDIGADEASIDFDPTVMQSGGDYSTLALWEAGVQTDLTVNTTRVFLTEESLERLLTLIPSGELLQEPRLT